MKLQDDKTYQYWLRQQLALAQNMNEEDCNELAASYRQLIRDNRERLYDSKDRQYAIKHDAYQIKGEEGEGFVEYAARLRAEFD